MTTQSEQIQQLLDGVESLREEVGSLHERISTLESCLSDAGLQPGAINEELVATISAAIAAYLGVKPHIRQIRLLGSPTWARQGRVSIQASHIFSVRDR
jgi:methylmalonyl-CoA carboxyltransferase large subunit